MNRLRTAAVVTSLVLVAGGVAIWRTARSRRDAWRERAAAVCRCGRATRQELDLLAREGGGGLPNVARAELRTLDDECADLRDAVAHRSLIDELRRKPLDVRVGEQHLRDLRTVGAALEEMCGDTWRTHWDAVAARARDPSDAAQAGAAEYLRIRDTMCARRGALSAPPRPYALTEGAAEETARTCHP